LTKNNFTV